jgi:hypothetical protein
MLIYKITSPNTDLVYVGHTVMTLSKRLTCHRSAYKRWLAGEGDYCSSYKLLEHGDYSISTIEENSVLARETYWINAIPNTCNVKRGNFDYAANNRDYHQENKEEISARKKVHYAENKEELCAKSKARYAEKKEEINAKRNRKEPCPKCGRVVRHGDMARHHKTKRCQDHAV